MPQTLAAPSGQFTARPIRSAMTPPEGPKTVPVLIPVASNPSSDNTYVVDFGTFTNLAFISIVQSVFVDNTNGTQALTISAQGTGQTVSFPVGAQGYMPILAPEKPVFTITAAGSVDTVVQFINVPVPSGLWSSGSSTTITGRMGGISKSIAPAAQPVVQAAAYTTGNLVGAKLTFSNVVRSGVNTGIIQGAQLFQRLTTNIPYDLLLFNADPAATTFTDRANFAVAAADQDKIIGVINFAGPALLTSALYYQATAAGIVVDLTATSGTGLWGALIARGAITYTTTGDLLALNLRMSQD